ncbi:MAG: ABC transporter ATP-binding protein [Clostridia bacterium]|nr:ABC transporter ATP-binding protein [Clostridia bacterium]
MSSLLSIRDLTIAFGRKPSQSIVTDRVGFDIQPGEILSLVGESGCGKSITAMSILGLLPRQASVLSGEILFDGKDLLKLSEHELDLIRGNDISMIFQDIMFSLNPVFTIGNQLCEGMIRHLHLSRDKAFKRAVDLLTRTGLPNADKVMRKFPHQLSGGQRQRVMISMALACRPRLLIADEPTTALDVTIQMQIMNLLQSLRRETGMSILLITHDIGLVNEFADRVVVMYAGQCIETGRTRDVLARPAHAYTNALLQSVPDVYRVQDHLYSIPGAVPERYDRLRGCRFAPRCPMVSNCPFRKLPDFQEIEPGHYSRCANFSKENSHVNTNH